MRGIPHRENDTRDEVEYPMNAEPVAKVLGARTGPM
jgi:hypothetical protein